jgi:anti-sigma factor RsiW
MWNAGKVSRLVAAAAVAVSTVAVQAQTQTSAPTPTVMTAQRFANGHDWQKSSPDQKRTFMFGIANALSVAVGWDARHVPEGQLTFSRRAREGLAGTTLDESVRRVDAWYQANPGRLDTAVVAVLWLDIAKPKIAGGSK